MSTIIRNSMNHFISNNISLHTIHSIFKSFNSKGRVPIVTNTLDCNIVVNRFKLQSYYFIVFRTNTLMG